MNLYGHKYLGPGNKLSNGRPIDNDDRIARIHDNLYNLANTEEDIRRADREAINYFIGENSLHGLIGAAGLGLKYGVESLTGVLYPNMKRGPSAAQLAQREKYAKVQKQLANIRRETGLSFREIQQAHSRDAWNDLQRPGPSERAIGSSSGNIREDQQPNKQQHKIIPESPDSTQTDNNSHRSSNDLDTAVNGLWSDMENMDFDQLDAPLAATGPSGASGRSSHPHSGGRIVRIPRPMKVMPMIYTFRQTRIFFTYGIACTKVQSTPDVFYSTPLALVPVDFPGFFMTPSEFKELPNNAFAKEARVVIKPLGVRTAFEYGGTTSGHTTNEFVPIGLHAIGLNKNTEIRNVNYVALDNMMPSAYDNVKAENMIARYYTDDNSHLNMIPRHAPGYALFVQPGTKATAANFWSESGMRRNDQFVDQFLINTAIGQPIINYNYKFKHAPLSLPFYNVTNTQAGKMYRGMPVQRSFTAKPVQPETSQNLAGESHTKEVADNVGNYGSTVLIQITHPFEKNGFSAEGGAWPFEAQPQIHVGIAAVPAMKPSTDTTTFQNTSAYWSAEAELDVEINHGSYYSSKFCCVYPRHAHFWSYPESYGTGTTLSGLESNNVGVKSTARASTSAQNRDKILAGGSSEPHTPKSRGPQEYNFNPGSDRFSKLALEDSA